VAAFDGLSNPGINAGITIHELLEFLDTLKTTLEELYLEINFTDYRMSHRMPRLTSLCHFTALRVLDTAARMWELFLFDEQEIQKKIPLTDRLPASLERRVFHGTHVYLDPITPHPEQIKHVINQQAQKLVNLKSIAIQFLTDEVVETMRESLDGIDCGGLDIQLGLQPPGRLTLRPVFQVIPTPVIEWTDEKYTSA
jgi:hypothetical protein